MLKKYLHIFIIALLLLVNCGDSGRDIEYLSDQDFAAQCIPNGIAFCESQGFKYPKIYNTFISPKGVFTCDMAECSWVRAVNFILLSDNNRLSNILSCAVNRDNTISIVCRNSTQADPVKPEGTFVPYPPYP